MLPIILLHQQICKRRDYINQLLQQANLNFTHPDVLFFDEVEKLGIEKIRKIQDFFNLKPYQTKQPALVIISSENLTPEAQNSLLKILEEPTHESLIILGAEREEQLLPTILSRCQIINLKHEDKNNQQLLEEYQPTIKKLAKADIEERFQIIDKITDKEAFLTVLLIYYHQHLVDLQDKEVDFLKDLMRAEQWVRQYVNPRAILEYLMLKMPN